MIKFDDLVANLMADVPAKDDQPTPPQYQKAVRQAVNTLNHNYGRLLFVEIEVVSGTAEYDLPADFVRKVRFDSITETAYPGSNVTLSSGRIIRLCTGLTPEKIIINGSKLVIFPTPEYSMTRTLWYRAGHVLEANDDSEQAYLHMTPQEADAVHLKAKANAYRLIAAVASANEGWSYQIGDFKVDKTKLGETLRKTATDLDNEFVTAVAGLIGNTGRAA